MSSAATGRHLGITGRPLKLGRRGSALVELQCSPSWAARLGSASLHGLIGSYFELSVHRLRGWVLNASGLGSWVLRGWDSACGVIDKCRAIYDRESLRLSFRAPARLQVLICELQGRIPNYLWWRRVIASGLQCWFPSFGLRDSWTSFGLSVEVAYNHCEQQSSIRVRVGDFRVAA